MSKTLTTMAVVVMMAAGTATPDAQTADATTSPTGRAEMTANHLLPGQIRVTEMTGAAVYDQQNQKIGSIKDIILDRDGRVAAVVLNVGGILGMGGRYVAIGIDDLKIANTAAKPRFTVDMSRDQLRTAQAFNLHAAERTGASPTPDERPR